MTAFGPVITIVDYGAGNLRSIQNMLRHLSIESEIAAEPDRVLAAAKLILPGVGKFDFGMAKLKERGLLPALNRRVIEERTPVLGICLGAQLLTRSSEEGVLPGLGWIAGRTVRFDAAMAAKAGLKVPHMGWADTTFAPGCRLFAGVTDVPRFYYVHSYHLDVEDAADVACQANHGATFTAGVEHGNVLGVQFHPEKSHAFGMKLLENFAKLY